MSISVLSSGKVASPVTFTINPVAAPSVITSLSPSLVTAGGPLFALTVNGTGFVYGATVQWNGTALTTTFVSATQLTASVAASLIASAGTAAITVAGGGKTSTAFSLVIQKAGANSQTYYFSQLPAIAGGWQTTLTYINYSAQSVTCTTSFYSDSGALLALPFSEGTFATRTDVLPPGGSVHDQTTASLTAAATTGWAQSLCTGPVEASVLFRSLQPVRRGTGRRANAEPTPVSEICHLYADEYR